MISERIEFLWNQVVRGDCTRPPSGTHHKKVETTALVGPFTGYLSEPSENSICLSYLVPCDTVLSCYVKIGTPSSQHTKVCVCVCVCVCVLDVYSVVGVHCQFYLDHVL